VPYLGLKTGFEVLARFFSSRKRYKKVENYLRMLSTVTGGGVATGEMKQSTMCELTSTEHRDIHAVGDRDLPANTTTDDSD